MIESGFKGLIVKDYHVFRIYEYGFCTTSFMDELFLAFQDLQGIISRNFSGFMGILFRKFPGFMGGTFTL